MKYGDPRGFFQKKMLFGVFYKEKTPLTLLLILSGTTTTWHILMLMGRGHIYFKGHKNKK